MITAPQALAYLTARMAAIAGAPIEITVRGERAFTFSLGSVNVAAAQALVDFFSAGGMNRVSVEHDEECGSFVYVDVR